MVWKMFFSSFHILYWEESTQLTLMFFRGVGIPPTRYPLVNVYISMEKHHCYQENLRHFHGHLNNSYVSHNQGVILALPMKVTLEWSPVWKSAWFFPLILWYYPSCLEVSIINSMYDLLHYYCSVTMYIVIFATLNGVHGLLNVHTSTILVRDHIRPGDNSAGLFCTIDDDCHGFIVTPQHSNAVLR